MRVSFENFPPKPLDGSDALWQPIGQLEPLRPNFMSVTYVHPDPVSVAAEVVPA